MRFENEPLKALSAKLVFTNRVYKKSLLGREAKWGE
jgi:hypothetical protein